MNSKNYSEFCRQCNKFADALMDTFLVSKFNYLPPEARKGFAQFVQKLQDEFRRLEEGIKQVTSGPLKGNYVYGVDHAMTKEEVDEVTQMFMSGNFPIGTVISQNSDGTCQVALNMMEGKVLDEATGRVDDNTLINYPMEFEETGETLDDDLVFEQPVKDVPRSMTGVEYRAKEVSKHMKNLGKILKNTKLKAYDDVIEKEDVEEEDNPFKW